MRCSVNNCERQALAKGFCDPHYRRFRGEIRADKPIRRKHRDKNLLCSVPDCTQAEYANGFCSKHNIRMRKHGDPLKIKIRPRGSGGLSRGYMLVKSSSGDRRPEHILIAEAVLGRPLPDGAEVHHVDGVRSNNKNTNLVICRDHSYHMLLHARAKALDACGNANWKKCRYCKRYDDQANLYCYSSSRKQNAAYHVSCATEYNRKLLRSKQCHL